METYGKFTPEIEEFLKADCQRIGCEPSLPNMIEALTEGEEVSCEIGSAHRWYDEETKVVRVNGRLIQYDWFHVTGDNSISDMGLQFDLNQVVFCEEYQETVTKYRPVK